MINQTAIKDREEKLTNKFFSATEKDYLEMSHVQVEATISNERHSVPTAHGVIHILVPRVIFQQQLLWYPGIPYCICKGRRTGHIIQCLSFNSGLSSFHPYWNKDVWVFPKMFPPCKPDQISFIDKYIRAALIFSPSKNWKSIILLWHSQTQTTEELPCSCAHTLLPNLILTETMNYQSTPSLWNELNGLWACKELHVKE